MTEDLHTVERPGLVALLIRERTLADALMADAEQSPVLLPRLVAVSLLALTAFAAVQGGLLALGHHAVVPGGQTVEPVAGVGVVLLAYVGGFFGAAQCPLYRHGGHSFKSFTV